MISTPTLEGYNKLKNEFLAYKSKENIINSNSPS